MLRLICGVVLVHFVLASPMKPGVKSDEMFKRDVCPPGKGDQFWYCDQFKKYCDPNSIYYRYVSKNCPVTCELCEAAPTTPPAPTPAPVAQAVSVNAADCLSAHNIKRNLHKDTPFLTYDDSLAQASQAWALKLAKENSDPVRLVHGSSGENIAYFGSTGNLVKTCRHAVESWYSEIQFYNWNKPGSTKVKGKAIGHFTQVVWKNTARVGCGIAKIRRSPWNHMFIVCRYSPAGNVTGRYGSNVMALK